MPLIDIFKRASRLVLNLQNSNTTTSYEEGEIVFCKNNVCVHPPTILRQETEIIHHPGYLTISCQRTNKYCDPDNNSETSLILTWIPNTTLRKCPSSVEKLSANKSQERRLRASPKLDLNSPNRKQSLHSVTSFDSQESALSSSLSSELRSVTNSEEQVSPAEPGLKTGLPDFGNGLSVESTPGVNHSLPQIGDEYSLQVEMLDNDDVCRITMEKNNFNDDDQDTSKQNASRTLPQIISDTESDLKVCGVTTEKSIPSNSQEFSERDLSIAILPNENLESDSDHNQSINSRAGKDCGPGQNSEATNQDVKQILPCANLSNENKRSSNLKDNENKFYSTELQSNKSIEISTEFSEKLSEELTILQSKSIVQTKLINVKGVSFKEASESTSGVISESAKEESVLNIPDSCASRNRSDSLKNEVVSLLEGSFTNYKPNHEKPDGLESSEETELSKDRNSGQTSKCSSLNQESENELESPNHRNEEDSSVKNSPSKLNSLSNSGSSDFTYPTSINSVHNSAEREAGVLKSPSDGSDTNSCDSNVPMWTYSSEYLNRRRYLPESNSASPATIRQIQRSCQRFSVDLGEMRSLRLFFSNGDTSSGQLVIASRESQYKILHFHHGGLDKLAKILHEWNRLTNFDPSIKNNLEDMPYRHFMICRPEVNENDLHPEEGKVPVLTEEFWWNLLNELGQIEDPLFLRKSVFFNGLPPQLRRTVWPFLLQIYSYQSTFSDRETISKIRKLEYQEIIRRRLKLTGINKENFTRNVQYVIEKDVVRTDRNNPFYAGDANPNLETMKNILLNYAVYDSSLGYLQGMSDLLAPLLAEIRDESESFWCFCGLMQRRLFVCTPTDADMEKNLRYLRELIRIMVPTFYSHLLKHEDAMELLFCHRWILLCFKREFPETIVFQIWEACWSNYLIDYFHLFVCLAIVAAYSPDVIAQDLRTDEMLLHFSSLSMYMDGVLILKKARWLLYKFRQLLVIPCSLAMLCQFSGPGMWDNSHTPSVKCLDDPKYCPDTPCPHRGSFAMDS